MKEKREFRESMTDAVKLYNNSLNSLTGIACHKNPDDYNVAKIRETLRAVLVADETIVIIQSGLYVWKYREQIATKDETFFLDNTFKSDIELAKQQLNDVGKAKDFTDDEIATIMQSLKGTYSSMTAPEREVVWRHVMDLLKAYAQYLGAERKLRKLEAELKQLASKK